jgi:hypothetical protein
MTDRPSSTMQLIIVLLTALGVAACAGTGAQRDAPSPEESPQDRPRAVLEATTPRAAARSDASSDAPNDPADPGDGEQPGRLLIYSAITGHVPLREQSAQDAADRYRSPAEREAARARAIEAEIEEELARQEHPVVEETGRAPAPEAPAGAGPAPDPGANPLDAPDAPVTRELPERLFESQEVTIPPGRWQNQRELHVVRRDLDIDRDGQPEEIRYVDPATGALIRSEQDLDYDGTMDAWITYENGEVAVRVLDTSGDGRSDVWERYANGRMNARTLDQDADGVKDTFYRYEGDQLVEKLRDANNDGTIDKVEAYRDRHRLHTEEDRSLNGWMDTWTRYRVVEGREVVASIERDSRDHGKPDVVETYETSDGQTRLARKEEDVDGDGTVDIVSIYEDGKLVQRAISDETLSPL